jgi:hypothetical protein
MMSGVVELSQEKHNSLLIQISHASTGFPVLDATQDRSNRQIFEEVYSRLVSSSAEVRLKSDSGRQLLLAN